MAIRIALHHETVYRFDRDVSLAPHMIRLRPAPHCRTAITGYSLTVEPAGHFLNWQQDPQGNQVARVVFPKQTRALVLRVDLVASGSHGRPLAIDCPRQVDSGRSRCL